ncbi:kinase [Actinomyces viscosus]|uniref:Ribokinase n=1 Tax=Actinomyces viscosus TaxID=1656 RepID=A0A3S4VAU4_ACTVI|nr:PfkB family carbohydrate kinase [Actinomyces viscosus]TFH52551.1 kinase [Actinomyces viscosus]VEI16369.1 ribokinase [Actinomyces viscosus]
MSGRVLHTGQVVIDLTLRLEAVPEPGADVFADEADMAVGGGFNVLAAARRLDVETLYAGPLGEGPFAQAARGALEAIGVAHVGPITPGDQGYCVAMTDARAERTFVSTRGAETRGPVDAFDHLEVRGDDVVYLSGYSLTDTASTAALERLVGRLVEARVGCTALFDVSPMVGSVPLPSLERIGALGPIWSLNEREAGLLADRLGLRVEAGDHAGACEALSGRLGTVLVRAGEQGSWFADGGAAVHTPSIPVTPVDTNGAGDAHSGVLAAALARGTAMTTALRWANVAGALTTTRFGPATCPSQAEIRALA